MKKTLSCLIIFTALVLAHNNTVAQIGRIWPSEKRTWIDAEFGCEITQWTNHPSGSWPLYFNIATFIDENHAIIVSERTGSANLFRLDLRSGELLQMTDEQALSGQVWHWPHLHTLWYLSDSVHLVSLDTRTLKRRDEIVLDRYPRSFTVTCDGRYAVYACDVEANSRNDHRRFQSGPFVIFSVELATKKVQQISPEYGFVIGHLQANPVDPRRILYCWQHLYRRGEQPGILGETPQRIWWIDVEGLDGGAVGPQEFGLHRTHEFWYTDGSRIGYSARYKFGPKAGEEFLGSCKADGSDNFMISAPVSFAHSRLFKDQIHWVVDLYDGNVLTLLTIENRSISTIKPLFRHDSSWQSQASHPHPQFSPSGDMIIFGTDKTGQANVYTVKINLNEI